MIALTLTYQRTAQKWGFRVRLGYRGFSGSLISGKGVSVFRRILLSLCLWGLSSGLVSGQQTGQIVGRVTDSSGAVVTGAKVTVTEVATGFGRNTTTGESGQFVFPPEVVPWFADSSIDRMQYGPLDIDRRHRIVISWVWDLPTMRSENPFVKYLVNGWQWTGIGQYQTGSPYEVTSGRDNSLDGIGADRARLTGSAIDAPAGADKRVWFSGDAFATNTVGTFGVIGPNAFTGPGLYSYDMGVFKRFLITERANVQFRAEFFNVFNQVNFNNPNSNVSGGGFGTITSTHSFAGDPRIMQFGLKLTF